MIPNGIIKEVIITDIGEHSMLTVVDTIKQGNKIIGYICRDGAETITLSRRQLSQCIDMERVSNARKQLYKGKEIIRVDGPVDNKEYKTLGQRLAKVDKIKQMMGVEEVTFEEFLGAKARGDRAPIEGLRKFDVMCDEDFPKLNEMLKIPGICQRELRSEAYNTMAHKSIIYCNGKLEEGKCAVQVVISLVLDLSRILAQVYISGGVVSEIEERPLGTIVMFSRSRCRIIDQFIIGNSIEMADNLFPRIAYRVQEQGDRIKEFAMNRYSYR